MTDQSRTRFPQFYITAPQPCPYLPSRYEKKIFTHLLGEEPIALNNALSQAGFRRSQNIAYRPACDECHACVSVRIIVDKFSESRNFRRILSANSDLSVTNAPAVTTDEQYMLLRRYLDARHSDGGMADMSRPDYSSMVEDTTIDTILVEYRQRSGPLPSADDRLIGVSLTDRLDDGLSMVYSYYEPDEPSRSLGTWMILDHIRQCRRLGLPYLYLGYWVEGSRKMSYKTRFRPLESLSENGWQELSDSSS